MKLNKKFIFNMVLIIFPWLSVLFIGKRSFKRFSFTGIFIIVFEILNHMYGKKRKWWVFYGRSNSFLLNELPFSIGPYMPVTLWLLKLSYGNFKKFILLNAIFDGIFAAVVMKILKAMKIIRLNNLNTLQFFFYIHYKAYLLYGIQYWYENMKDRHMYLLRHKLLHFTTRMR